MKDKRVSLCGTRESRGQQPICSLPPGYRPQADQYFTRPSDVGQVGVIVAADGRILVSDATRWTSFDGITFEVAEHRS